MRQSSSSYSTISLLQTLFLRHFSTKTTRTKTLPSLTKTIPSKYRSIAIQQAQEVLTRHLQNTSALPFTYAQLISKNSIHSISEIISKVPFSSSAFRYKFQSFLLYNPINEFGFFYESIGIDYLNIHKFLKPDVQFCIVFDAACCLAEFGFPWDKLGRLYVEEDLIFRQKPEVLRGRLDGLVSLGFGNQQIIGICFAFPGLLKEQEKGGLDCDYDALLDDLKRVFLDLDLESCMVGNSDVWFEVCEKVKFFYELGVKKGEFLKLIVSILTCYPMETLGEKVEFFSRLGFEKSEIGVLILSNPKILGIKIEDRVISVSSILKHFGLCKEKLLSVEEKYAYVFGRNKMVNLPSILRALDLHEWFFDRMKCGDYKLFDSYDLSSPDDGLDENYVQHLESLKTERTYSYSFSKLKFLHGIGFGENGLTVKLFASLQGSAGDLQERFDFLLSEGIEFSKLFKMMSRTPKILNQEMGSLKKKLQFFVEEIDLPLNYLETFPSYFLYNLETRIKPRYKFHVWLTDQGLCTKKITLATIISVGHKGFVSQLSRIHPSAPQLWMEQYGNKKVDL
ncbi:transcription termination factor MTEF18, mitochondrial-like [Silene latifolia]|uniref:transcription termination factor MTEF18, mitochondrial-like n=1 Tax=Silene latifolia TaxID=37657 RepID=UPI003D7833E7